MHVVGLRDGSSIVFDGLVAPAGGAWDPEPEPGTLSGPSEIVFWVGEAVAAGVTFDVLKEIVLGLVQRGWSRRTGMVDAVGVAAIVRNYLESTGYVEILVTEIREVEGAGWSLAGSADGARFRALADPHGAVTHVRVK